MTVGKIETTLNPLPTLTWNWLGMNRAKFEENLPFKKESARLDASGLCEGFSFSVDDSDAAAFQDEGGENAAAIKGLAEIQTALDLKDEDFSPLLQPAKAVLRIDSGAKAAAPIVIRITQNGETAAFTSLAVIAGEGADATVIIDLSSKGSGLSVLQTKVFAGKNSRIHLVTVQLLGQGFVSLNDIGGKGGENSALDVTQIELGARKMFSGVYSNLGEAGAKFKNDMSYYLNGERELDMNFVALQSGKRTDSAMRVYGTLKDSAKKTYRGTIDFRKGCSGATGDEQEETLLLSPAVVNKSIPLILCDEEDVSGEHGATIGRMGEDILFYMKSRGISLEAAEEMMARAKISRVAALIGHEETERKISEFLDEIWTEKK